MRDPSDVLALSPTGVVTHSCAAVVARLSTEGYVTRRPHPRDGRAQLVVLTRRGREVTDLATRAAFAQWDDAAERVGAWRLATFVAVLDQLGGDAAPRPVW